MKIVTTFKTRVAQIFDFSQTYLLENLNQQAVAKKQNQTMTPSISLANAPQNGSHIGWFYVLQHLLNLARQGTPLMTKDFDYLYKCLASAEDGEHRVGSCDPSIFEILKYAAYNKQLIPKKFVDKCLKSFSPNIRKESKIWEFAMGVASEASDPMISNIIDFMSKFFNPSHPDLRIAYMRSAVPYILQNMAESCSLDQSIFDELVEIANHSNLCKFLPMLAIASRNHDFSKLSEKLRKIDNHVQGDLPEIFASFIEVKAKHSAKFEITNDMLMFLQAVLEPSETAPSFEQLFGGFPKNIRKSDSRKNRCYSCWKSDFKIVLGLLDLTSQKKDLTIEEIRYLGLQLRPDYVKDEDLMKQTIILSVLHQVSYSGQILHDETLKNLEKTLGNTKDLQTKKGIVLILAFALRNKQILSSQTKTEMAKILDYGRISAANAIKYYLERPETKNPSKITLKFLKTIHGSTQNQLLKESLVPTIRAYIAKFPATNKKFEELDDKELLNDPKLSLLYEEAALGKQILSPVACENLAIIISSNDKKYSIHDKRTSSSAL